MTTGVLIMSYGTARGPDDLEAYYTHIRHGRPPTPELLADLRSRYEAIGGESPLIHVTEMQVDGIERALRARGLDVRAYHGMKHQTPSIEDAIARMGADRVERAVGLVLAPHYSRFSVGEYTERARAAAQPLGLEMSFVESFNDVPDFISLLASRLRDAIAMLPEEKRTDVPVIFSAHSLPVRILESGDPYPQQLEETASLVAKEMGLTNHVTAWQSAGRTGEEWLGPDLCDVLRELGRGGAKAAVSCPCGFVADHLEILYDIDIEAQDAAHENGMTLVRTESPNADPVFTGMLADLIAERI